jgi:hypothetical protein
MTIVKFSPLSSSHQVKRVWLSLKLGLLKLGSLSGWIAKIGITILAILIFAIPILAMRSWNLRILHYLQRTSGKVLFFSKIWKIWQKSNEFQNFFFCTIRKSSKFFEQKFELFLKKSSNFFWRKVQTKFERTLNELQRNSSNSSIQVSPRCFLFRWCLFMIYENTCNISEAFNRTGQSATICDH